MGGSTKPRYVADIGFVEGGSTTVIWNGPRPSNKAAAEYAELSAARGDTLRYVSIRHNNRFGEVVGTWKRTA